MTHLDEERLVALCFGDGTPADAAHAASCAECAAAADRLRAMLAAVEPGDIPERGEDYGASVWERLQARLEAERAVDAAVGPAPPHRDLGRPGRVAADRVPRRARVPAARPRRWRRPSRRRRGSGSSCSRWAITSSGRRCCSWS